MFILYIVVILAALYVIFSLFMANFMAAVLYEVPKKFAPTKKWSKKIALWKRSETVIHLSV